MKLVSSFLLLALSFVVFSSSTITAQVLNSGFENDLPQGGIQHWTNITIFPFPADSLVIDSALYFRNSDPHSGDHALELRNGYNGDTKYAGYVQLTEDDSSYQGFARGMSYTELPKYFTFYYKFFPAATTDTARATITLLNGADGDIRGSAEVLLSNTTSVYTEAVVPITYTGDGPPTHLFIEFSTKTANSTPSYGTRFLVDDVGLRNSVSSVTSETSTAFHVSASPNPASTFILFEAAKDVTNKLTLSIFTIEGEKISQEKFTGSLSLPVANYARGTYFYTIVSEDHSTVNGKFILK